MRFLGKRGELTSRQIVLIILVIAGLIIGVLFFALFFEERPDKEVCRLSVVERASAPFGKEVIPLKCTTEKICITTRKSKKCKEFAGEENIRYVTLDIPLGKSSRDIAKRKEAVKTIERETANAMFDCWKMTGEGQLDIFGEDGFAKDIANQVFGNSLPKNVRPKCIVCSRLAISDSVRERDKEVKAKINEEILSKVDANKYMVTEKVPGSKLTYLQTFTDESISGYVDFSKSEALAIKSGKVKPKSGISQLAMVFVQIKVTDQDADAVYSDTFKTGLVAGGTAMLFGPGRLIVRATGLPGAIVAGLAIGAISASYASTAQKSVESNQMMAAVTCGKFLTHEKRQEQRGCSLVKAMTWEVDGINELCSGGIESNF